MECPNCNSKLKCFNSRQLDKTLRIREYVCFNCENNYKSEEKLNIKVVKVGVQNNLKEGN